MFNIQTVNTMNSKIDSYNVIVDIQGFTLSETNQFICKEFAILNLTNNNICKTGIFKQPYPFSMLSEENKKCVQLSVKNDHNLEWCSGAIAYSKHKSVLKSVIEQWGVDTVYVLGENKLEWLKTFLHKKIRNLDKFQCPPLSELRSPIQIDYCMHHLKNCAVRNVMDLSKWFHNRFNTLNSIKLFAENGQTLANMHDEDIIKLPLEFVLVYAENEIDSEWYKLPIAWQNNELVKTYRKCIEHNCVWSAGDDNFDNENDPINNIVMIKDCLECNTNK